MVAGTVNGKQWTQQPSTTRSDAAASSPIARRVPICCIMLGKVDCALTLIYEGASLCRTLEVLQDQVDPKPFPAVERVLRQELGAGAEELFAEFDHDATAAASLAQVLIRSAQV